MDDKPCCAAAAVRKVKQLTINGITVGITHLDESINEVKSLGLDVDSEVANALLRNIRIYNYVPSISILEYKKALLDEYKRRR